MVCFLSRFAALVVLTALPRSLIQAGEATAPRPQGPLELDTPVLHVKIKPELLGQHPRIYLTEVELAAIKQKLPDPRLATMVAWFINDADRVAAMPVPANVDAALKPDIRHNEGYLEQLAFAYLVTGDVKYLTAWRHLSQAILNWPRWGDDLGRSHLLFGLAVTYEWLYHVLTGDERQGIETALLLRGRDLFRDPVTGKPDWWDTAYFQPAGFSAATWLITVTGVGQQDCSMVRASAAPEIKVGSDDIAWTADGAVSLNGQAITGNLMPPPGPATTSRGTSSSASRP